MQTNSQASAATPPPTSNMPEQDLRVRRATVLKLVELNPELVISGARAPGGLVAPDVTLAGTMRETCPHCQVPLQLVLRHKHVIRSHLFCAQCTRCFDALYVDGRSALAFAGLSID